MWQKYDNKIYDYDVINGEALNERAKCNLAKWIGHAGATNSNNISHISHLW